MILPAVLFGLIQQSELQDVHIRAASLDRVVQQISEQFRSPMTISTNLKNQILVVEANQVSEATVRDQIAKAVDGTWEMKDSGWHLGQSAKQIGMEHDRREKLRLRMLEKTLEYRLKSRGFRTPLTSASALGFVNQMKSQQGSFFGPSEAEYGEPSQRLVTKILAKLNLAQIAKIDNGERQVLALKPNSMQQRLDMSLDKELDDYRKEIAIWSAALRQVDGNSDVTVKSGETSGGGQAVEAYAMPEEVDNILVSVYTTSSGPQELSILFLPKNPRESFMVTRANSTEGMFAAFTLQDIDSKESEDNDFKMSEESQEFAKFYGQDSASIPKEHLHRLVDQLADPVKRDPLSFGVSEMLAYDCVKLKQNIVAVLIDDDLTNQGVSFSNLELLKKLEDFLAGAVVRENGWIRLNLRTLEGMTVPRPELKRIIANVRVHRRVSLEDLSDIASVLPRSQNMSSIVRLLEGFSPSSSDESGEDDAIRAMGLLDMNEQNRAMSPAGIPYGELSQKVRQHLFESSFYNLRNQLKVVGGDRQLPNYALTEEPTLLAPNGIANSSIFRITREGQNMIRLTSKEQPEGFWASPREFGDLKVRMENPKDFPGNTDAIDFTKPMSRATKMVYRFLLSVNPTCYWTSSLERTTYSNDPPFTFESMPEDLRREFEMGYKNAKANFVRYKLNQNSTGKGDGG